MQYPDILHNCPSTTNMWNSFASSNNNTAALYERVINEFDQKEIDKYSQVNFCDNVEKILDEKDK
jgi:hypothetical protein